MQPASHLRLIILLSYITLNSCLKCYTCSTSSEKNCHVKQKLEECKENHNICLTIYHTNIIQSGNETLVKSRYHKSCARTTRTCRAFCQPFQGSKECKTFCCNRDGCNKISADRIVISAKHTSGGGAFSCFYWLILFANILCWKIF